MSLKRFIDTFVKRHKPAPESTRPRKRIVLETYVETLKPAPEETRPSNNDKKY